MQDTEFLSAFDAGNDGISYSEYLLLLTFLKIPAQVVHSPRQSLCFPVTNGTEIHTGQMSSLFTFRGHYHISKHKTFSSEGGE